jgi:hypothetical protein
MAWTPTETLLGTHAEMATFSHTIEYYTEEAGDPTAVPPTTGSITYYSVRIIPQQTNPYTVSISGATISGYYRGIFNDGLTTRDSVGNITTITTLGSNASVWDAVNRSKVHEVIGFDPDMTRSRTFTYLAEAYNPLLPNTVIASQTYTILCEDKNWTPGMLSLKELVSYASNN